MTEKAIQLRIGDTSTYYASIYVDILDSRTLVLNNKGELYRIVDELGNYKDTLDKNKRSILVEASYKGNLVRRIVTLTS
jgi:hypothetical protein